MDSISKIDDIVPSVTHIQDHDISVGKTVDGVKDNIIPLKQEAIDDAQHIHLSWRSWVNIYALIFVTRFTILLTLIQLVVFITCFAYGWLIP